LLNPRIVDFREPVPVFGPARWQEWQAMAKPKTPVQLENPVQLGTIGAAHGIKGELRVKTFTEDPRGIGGYGPLHLADGRTLTVAGLRPAKDVVIVRFAQVRDRSAAEALNGEALFVDRSALPEALEDDEFYHADLVGLTVRDETGEELGRVTAVHDFGAGDLLEIRPASGPSLMIPFTHEAVPEIDIAGGVVRIDRIAAGLGEEAEGERGEEAPLAESRTRSRGPEAGGGR
jgi:16S rRNA processing protein RimM